MSSQVLPAPQRTLKEAILQLWSEARNLNYIAAKLNITDEHDNLDTEAVLSIIEDPANYPSSREYYNSCCTTT